MANSQKSKVEFFKSDDDRRRHCCKKHPKHRQSPGVCSLCLSEKLSHILSSATSSSRKASSSLSSSSSSSYYSSASSCSSCSSPVVRRDLYTFSMDQRKAPISSIFKKSRSLAFATRSRRGREGDNGKKNLGFWSKFLSRPRRKRMEEVLTHSRTVVQGDVHG